MVMAINYRERIIALWTVFLLGTLFHTELGLMPLFHGLSVIESQKATNINDISGIMWLMLGFFVLPMLAIILTIFYRFKALSNHSFWLNCLLQHHELTTRDFRFICPASSLVSDSLDGVIIFCGFIIKYHYF